MSSLRHQRRRKCGTKVRWASLETAQGEAARLRRAHPGDIGGYKCCYCGGWHVGHTPSPFRNSAAKTLAQMTALIERSNS